MENNFDINIAHLYPDLLNIYGDFGNISTIKHRLNWRNINVNIDNLSLNDDIQYDKYDIFYIGGGSQDAQQELVANDLKRHKDNFRLLAESGVVMLAVDAGYQLFGNYYTDKNNKKIDGIGIFDSYTIYSAERLTGNVTIQSNINSLGKIVGFENHSTLTYLENNTQPLGNIIIGNGNNTDSKNEGAIFNSVIGTYLHGPVLPKNPLFCDFIIESAIRKKLNEESYTLAIIDDTLENLTHQNLVNKTY